MRKFFAESEKEIRLYCEEHGLDFEKIKKMGKCWGRDFLIIQFIDSEKGNSGLRNESPAEVVLVVKKDGKKILVEQTESTRKYLV